MAKPITPKAALQALHEFLSNRTPIPDTHMGVLRSTFGGLRVIALEEQTLDIEQTLSDLGLLKDTGGTVASTESKTLVEALTSGRPLLPSCPVTRQPLRKVRGKNGAPDREETQDGIDWQGIDTTWREVAGFAAELGRIETSPARVPYELRQTPPPPPWPELQKKWVVLKGKAHKSEAEEALVSRVLRRLVFQRPPEAPAAAGSSFPEAAPVSVSGNVQGSATIAGTGDIVHKGGYDRPLPPPDYNPCADATGPCRSQDCRFPDCAGDTQRKAMAADLQRTFRPTGPKLIYIMACAEDAGWVDRLNEHLRPLESRGLIELFDERRIPPGAVMTADRHAKLARAAMVIYVVSASLLSDPKFSYPNTLNAAKLAKHVPVIARSCLYQYTFGADLAVLPQSGEPLSGASDRDRAVRQVAEAILAALGVA